MKRVTIDTPPDPDSPSYKTNPLSYNRAVFDWMNKTKGKLEQASRQNDSPLSQNFVIQSFTTNTQLTGTSSGTDVSDFVCTLVAAFINKGIITAVTTATG